MFDNFSIDPSKIQEPWTSTPSTLPFLPPRCNAIKPKQPLAASPTCFVYLRGGSLANASFSCQHDLIDGRENRERRLHVTRRVVASDDVVSTATVSCNGHANLGGRVPDDLSCEGISILFTRKTPERRVGTSNVL